MFSKANLMKVGIGAGKMAVLILVYEIIEVGLDCAISKISDKKKSSTTGEEA